MAGSCAGLTLLFPLNPEERGNGNYFGFAVVVLSAAVWPVLLKRPLPQDKGLSQAFCGCVARGMSLGSVIPRLRAGATQQESDP